MFGRRNIFSFGKIKKAIEEEAARKKAAEEAARKEAARKRAAEARKRAEEARKRLCNNLKNRQLPRLERIIAESKKELEYLKEELKLCRENYNSGQCSRINDMNTDLATKNSLYANLKSTLINLKDTYDLDNCSITATCDKKLKYSELSSNNYNTGENILAVTTEKDDICNDPYRNKCATLLKDLEKSQLEIKDDLAVLKSTVEEFTNYNSDIDHEEIIENFTFSMKLQESLDNFNEHTDINNDIENTQKINDKLREIVYNSNKKDNDVIMSLDKEVCTNILLTTAGSVMLYYLLFENYSFVLIIYNELSFLCYNY
jgi:hypothetical protein